MSGQRGRPKKADVDKLVPLSTNVKAEAYDQLCRLAERRGLFVSECVREIVMRGLHDGHDDIGDIQDWWSRP